MDSLEIKVKKYIEQYISPAIGLSKEHGSSPRLIIALSGGADSVALLLTLSALGYECHAAHCNFHLRAEESMRDQFFAESLCKRLGIPLHIIDFDTTSYAQEHNLSIEMAAREQRYDYFRTLLKKTGAEAIAVGHHKDDNAETLLINLVRGTGIHGMCGIQPVNGNIIRPLLCTDRSEILDYLNRKGQSYVTDSTNLVDVYSRNRIRLDIIPDMKKINVAATDNINMTIQNLNEVKKVYDAAIRRDIDNCTSTRKDAVGNEYTYINKEKLNNTVSPISVLHEIVYPLGFNGSQTRDILNATVRDEKTGMMFKSQTHILTIDRDYIIIAQESEEGQDKDIPLDEFELIEKKTIPSTEFVVSKDRHFAYIDVSKLSGNLYIRKCHEGDSFTPFGMKGKKLLSDYMTDRKYSRLEKKNQLVLCDGNGEIVWLIGERCSEKYKVDDKTSKILVLWLKS